MILDQLTSIQRWLYQKRFVEKLNYSEIMEAYNARQTTEKQIRSIAIFHNACLEINNLIRNSDIHNYEI